MSCSLKDKLQKAGFKMSPQAAMQKLNKGTERGNWKSQAKERILNAKNPIQEIIFLINEAHELFKAQEGSGDWFRGFLHPLYELKKDLIDLQDLEKEMSCSELKIRVKKLW